MKLMRNVEGGELSPTRPIPLGIVLVFQPATSQFWFSLTLYSSAVFYIQHELFSDKGTVH